MSWTSKQFLFLYIVIVSVGLLLAIDFLFGGYLLPYATRSHLHFLRCTDVSFRIKHPVYHHDLSKNFQGRDTWGSLNYEMCTDGNGFKTSCVNARETEKQFDLAFIGDSFTEGIGLKYEDTFIGQIAAQLSSKKIANLGVSSYSPSIYFSKVNYLLEQGVTFNELVVYIDISDIQDEAINYALSDRQVINRRQFPRVKKDKSVARCFFPLTYQGLHVLKARFFGVNEESAASSNYLSFSYPRSAWTYNLSSPGYGAGGVEDGINQSVKAMTQLSELLKSKGIALSVGVYPWPAQILFDRVQSEQVRIWREFCKNRCKNFYNSFDSFFALKDRTSAELVIENFFIAGDVHHNQRGASVIAEDFLRVKRD